jgi:hypothetical protein
MIRSVRDLWNATTVKVCDETIDELQRCLAGIVHYTVLAKLDEAHLDRK